MKLQKHKNSSKCVSLKCQRSRKILPSRFTPENGLNELTHESRERWQLRLQPADAAEAPPPPPKRPVALSTGSRGDTIGVVMIQKQTWDLKSPRKTVHGRAASLNSDQLLHRAGLKRGPSLLASGAELGGGSAGGGAGAGRTLAPAGAAASKSDCSPPDWLSKTMGAGGLFSSASIDLLTHTHTSDGLQTPGWKMKTL